MTFDADGYPTEDTLILIRRWPIETVQDAIDAMDHVGRCWSYPNQWTVTVAAPECRTCSAKRCYVFSTGGWSGNESLVEAIESNQMLQLLGAWSWRRGGHYEYRFTEPEAKP